MNRATIANLNNSELARFIEGNQDIPREVIDELVVRFIHYVDIGEIDDSPENNHLHTERDERDDEIRELRSAINEAICALESV